jgi:hypothetical protein
MKFEFERDKIHSVQSLWTRHYCRMIVLINHIAIHVQVWSLYYSLNEVPLLNTGGNFGATDRKFPYDINGEMLKRRMYNISCCHMLLCTEQSCKYNQINYVKYDIKFFYGRKYNSYNTILYKILKWRKKKTLIW